MNTLSLCQLIPFWVLMCFGNVCLLNTQQDVEVWTVSGPPAHITLRHYIGQSGLKWDSNPQVIELQNEALWMDMSRSNRYMTLEAAILSPDSHYLMCHWVGIWPNTGMHSTLCVYDVQAGRLLLNWIPPLDEFYVDCDWLNADEIWCSTPQIEKDGVWQKQRYYAVSLATGQSRPLTAKEHDATLAALRTARKPVVSAAKAFKSLGFKPRPTREMGQSDIETDLNRRRMSSFGAVSSDGKLALLAKKVIENNTSRGFYQLLRGGKPLGQLAWSDIPCDRMTCVYFVESSLCISVLRGDRRFVQVWTPEQKPRLVTQLDGDWVVHQSLVERR